MDGWRRILQVLLAVIILANVAVFVPRLLQNRRAELRTSPEAQKCELEWQDALGIVDRPVVSWSGPGRDVSLAMRPAVGANYKYVSMTETVGRDMKSLVIGLVQVQAGTADALVIHSEDQTSWVLEGGSVTKGRGKLSSDVHLQAGSVVHEPPTKELPVAMFTADSYTPGLGAHSQHIVTVGSKWRGNGETLGDQPNYEVIGFAEIGEWKTIQIRANHNLNRGLALMKESAKSKNVPAAARSIFNAFAAYSFKESARLYIDIDTGMLIRSESDMTLSPKNMPGADLTMKTVFQLFTQKDENS